MAEQTVKQRVQHQFGDKAEAYATSDVHARGSSLERLVALTEPQSDWIVLDIATGAGHTAHRFAPYARFVLATDLTPQMLPKARALAQDKGFDNVLASAADAEALPFCDRAFDLVTCRLAPHHFPDVGRFIQECARVLRPGGLVAVVDNYVPGSRRRGKKARLQQEAGRYVNAFEKLRDPSHHRCFDLYEWRDLFYQAGFVLLHEETEPKEIDFYDYVARMKVPPNDITRLNAMLVQAPKEVLDFLTPVFRGDTIKFYLGEALFVGRLESSN